MLVSFLLTYFDSSTCYWWWIFFVSTQLLLTRYQCTFHEKKRHIIISLSSTYSIQCLYTRVRKVKRVKPWVTIRDRLKAYYCQLGGIPHSFTSSLFRLIKFTVIANATYCTQGARDSRARKPLVSSFTYYTIIRNYSVLLRISYNA